jgi:hypothetical protein
MTESAKSRDLRWPAAALLVLLLAVALGVQAAPASAARLTSSKAKSAVVKYVKSKWGSDYAVHPACYTLSGRKAKCFVHMVHASSTCTKYATVTLKSGRTCVSMAKPGC